MTDAPGPTGGHRYVGEAVHLYAFDVANEVRLDGIGELLSTRALPFAVQAGRPAPRSIPAPRPLVIEPPAAPCLAGDRPLRLSVRIYEVGVVNIVIRIAFAADTLAALRELHEPRLADGRSLDALARERCDEVRRELAGCLIGPGPVTEPESYTVFCLTDLGGERDPERWLAERRREVAGLLAGTEPDRLSESQVAEVLRLRRSFETTDLVVIDWDAALAIDLDRSPEDVLFVLELANLQLEEFRWLDRTIDRYLDRSYAELSRPRWPLGGGASGTLRSLRKLRVELAQLVDQVTHVTKFVGDWHLARVHLLARERFHLDQWRASVEQRLGQLDQFYTLTQEEVFNRRMITLELIIVILFVVDLAALILARL